MSLTSTVFLLVSCLLFRCRIGHCRWCVTCDFFFCVVKSSCFFLEVCCAPSNNVQHDVYSVQEACDLLSSLVTDLFSASLIHGLAFTVCRLGWLDPLRSGYSKDTPLETMTYAIRCSFGGLEKKLDVMRVCFFREIPLWRLFLSVWIRLVTRRGVMPNVFVYWGSWGSGESRRVRQ